MEEKTKTAQKNASIDAYHEAMLDRNLMQELQDRFCASNSVYAVCFSRTQGVITKAYGSKEELTFLHSKVGMDQYMSLLNKLINSSIENVVEEEIDEPFLRCCGVAVRVKDSLAAIWIVIAAIQDVEGSLLALSRDARIPEFLTMTTEKQFYRSLEFLETISKQFLTVKLEEVVAQEENKKSTAAREEVEKQLKRNEAVTNIVQMLESENSFAKIVNDILEQAVLYLDLGSASLLRVSRDLTTVDMICEWVGAKGISYLERMQQIPVSSMPFLTGKPYMVSSDSKKPESFEKLFSEQKIKAAVSLPVEVNGKAGMYLCFIENHKNRTWDVNDVKFLNDVRQIIQSILNKRIAKNSLASSYASLEAILENVGCGIYVEDPGSKRELFVNQTFRTLFTQSEDAGSIRGLFGGREFKPEEGFVEFYSDLQDRWYDVRVNPIKWVDGNAVNLYTIYDITSKKVAQQKVERQANNDFLTGLYNRMRCEQDLERYIKEAADLGGEGALLYIDLDDFKHINDGIGHQYGDLLLKLIAQSLQKIPGVENTCYRMGGDEFTIILAMHQYYMLPEILAEIRETFARPWYLNGEDYYCTMSMGIVRFPSEGDTAADVIKKADIALYEAKKNGKNHVVYYDDNVALTSIKRIDMERHLREAVMNGCKEFEVYFQPVTDIRNGRDACHGAEALVRWNSSELGFISPTDFVPLAEYLGLIVQIGDHVLEEACKHCKYWNDMGHPEYRINVNLSVVQLLQSDIAEKIRDVIQRTKIRPTNLTLEVTESLAINDMNRMKSILAEIKKVGVWIALDDFGTGYSSLNHIRELPIDIIKIDRCFVIDIARDEYSEVFVRMTTELADTLGIQTCVEGVEDDAQLEKLREMDVQYIQGYYFGTPITAVEFEAKYLEVG